MIAYRDATPADGPELDAMARAIWVATFGHASSSEDSAAYLNTAYGPQGALIRSLDDPSVHIRLGMERDRIVGYAKLTPPWVQEAERERAALQLSQLYIAADHHGRGVAQALMAWTLDTARARGAGALFLTVWEENARAIRFYDRYGFAHVGDYAFRVGEQVDRDLILRLTL